jgi:hypothetical protein
MEKNKNEQNIKLGGFPPILYISNENKKKREFNKKIEQDINLEDINKLNILNIKNILGQPKK